MCVCVLPDAFWLLHSDKCQPSSGGPKKENPSKPQFFKDPKRLTFYFQVLWASEKQKRFVRNETKPLEGEDPFLARQRLMALLQRPFGPLRRGRAHRGGGDLEKGEVRSERLGWKPQTNTCGFLFVFFWSPLKNRLCDRCTRWEPPKGVPSSDGCLGFLPIFRGVFSF